MPRYIIKPPERSPRYDRLVDRLAGELSSPGSDVQPLILEELVPATKSRHVHVIWDDWNGLPDEQRAEIVFDAYSKAEGPDVAAEIAIADGLTPAEALGLGLLPYQVVPITKKAAGLDEDSRRAIANEAARTLLGPKAGVLRYARLEDARDAVKRLRRALPRSSWEIVRDVPAEE